MLKAIKQTRVINSFRDDAVVPTSNLRRKYGKSLPTGMHLSDGKKLSDIYGNSVTTIDKMISGQNYVSNQLEKLKNEK